MNVVELIQMALPYVAGGYFAVMIFGVVGMLATEMYDEDL